MDQAQIQNLIMELIEKTTVKATNIVISLDNGTNTWFSVEVNEPHFFIGRDGEALYALNHLVKRIIESKMAPSPVGSSPAAVGERRDLGILIDINGFQKKRVENVRAVAHMMGERARYFKSSIEVDPMSPFERRIVHEFLSNATDLQTQSVGFGPTRRVVIKYVGNL